MERMFRFDADSLPDFSLFSKEKPFTIVMQLDGTGFGSLSIAQLIFRSVYTSQSPCRAAARRQPPRGRRPPHAAACAAAEGG
eukprot:7304379-Prymnesium_polylepis.1